MQDVWCRQKCYTSKCLVVSHYYCQMYLIAVNIGCHSEEYNLCQVQYRGVQASDVAYLGTFAFSVLVASEVA